MSLEQRRTIRNLPGGYMSALLAGDAFAADRANVAGFALLSDLVVFLEGFLAKLDVGGHLDASQIPTTVALLASPTFTGLPRAPTATLGDNSTLLANTAFVQAAVAALINGSPAALDTLKELADALGDDANFATTITNALALKAPLASPVLTGTPTAPTLSGSDNSTKLATTAMVQAALASIGVMGKNLVINGEFRVNQRAYVSAAALAAGSYGHDRWKAGAGGGDYSFTQLVSSTQITIAASKTLMQVIAGENIRGGNYALSWAGTAQARVGINGAAPAGAYAASPILLTGVNAAQNVTLEFGNGAAAGTLQDVQFEPGIKANAFEHRPYGIEELLCLRYFEVAMSSGLGQIFNAFQYAGGTFYATWPLKVRKRAIPTFALIGGSWVSNVPSVNPGIDRFDFTSGVGAYFLSGASNVPFCSASAEL